MRIPLDYYQILGVPAVATMGQIQQAYADRNLQQLRHEYTALAIESRRKLLAEAYEVLAHPAERPQYDALLMEADAHFAEGENPLATLDVDNERVLGGVILLSELGEYEKLLSIAWPLIGSDQALQQVTNTTDLEDTKNNLNLTVALALLELGRERWRQNEPIDGCAALETGIKLLRQQNIFPTVQAEIQKELHKFRPQYILSLLVQPNENLVSHQQVISLLQELVEVCSGRQGYTIYGMTQDGFIAYIDQIRRYLTTSEQQSLFEGPAIRLNNPVFTYLLVYAMVARGFHYRMPELIYRAKQMLLQNLGRRQDVFIEQALCHLLLGQQTEANQALEKSRDQETLNYIRKNSPLTSDLIQGLCRYSELWFQTQVYPHFLDLRQQKASLSDYFDDRQVQVYLDNLPQPENLSPPVSVDPQPNFSPMPTSESLPNYRGSVPLIGSMGITEPIKSGELVADLPLAERVGYPEPEPIPEPVPTNVVPFERPLKKRDSQPPQEVQLQTDSHNSSLNQLNNAAGGQLATVQGKELTRRPKVLSLTHRRRNLRFFFRLMLVAFTGLIGVCVVVLVVSTTSKWVNKSTGVAAKGGKLVSPPNVPATALPSDTLPAPALSTLPKTANTNGVVALLTKDRAQEIVETWLKAKAMSQSKQRDLKSLALILVDPALARAQQRAKLLQKDDAYWEYQHQVKVQSIASVPNQLESKTIEAVVNESASYFNRNNQRSQTDSYNKQVRVKYELINKNGQWFIKDMTVIQ